MMDPVTGISIAKSVLQATNKLYEIAKNLKDREVKQQIDEVLDELREFKKQASDLEEQNRDLRERLRFKSDDFEFKNPFWYEKNHLDRPLCPKCYTRGLAVPMSAEYLSLDDVYRRCLSCETPFEVRKGNPLNAGSDESGIDGWR